MQSESDQRIAEFVLSSQLADMDVSHPIVEDLFGNAAEVLEGANMAIQKGRQVRVKRSATLGRNASNCLACLSMGGCIRPDRFGV